MIIDLEYYLPLFSGLWALDLETRGTDAADPSTGIVGIGLANHETIIYVDWNSASIEAQQYIISFLATVELMAFNIMFDAAFLQQLTGKWLNWKQCNYGYFKQLSGEGWTGQKWNLGVAITDVLGWPVSNKTTLDTALKEYGLAKADMGLLPASILGPYCAADADAAWQLKEYFDECIARIP